VAVPDAVGKAATVLVPEDIFQIRNSFRKSKPPMVKVVLGFDAKSKEYAFAAI
jgi:hypothetical protein